MKFDQSQRLIKLSGPFGDEEVCGISFSASEAISRLFSFRLDFLCLNLKLTGKDLIGKAITVEIQRFDDAGKVIGSRYFHGYVSRLSGGELTTEQTMVYRAYQVELVPWFWFLTQTSTCHIFFPDKQEKTIKEIIEDVFGRSYHVKPKFDLKDASILGSRKVEHCVQYRETDFNFVSRILEQYGVHYYFTHAKGEHSMLLSDKTSYPACEESKVDFPRQSLEIKDNCVMAWEHQFEFVSGKYVHTDYNFEQALENLETNSPKISSELAPDVPKYEIYDSPGEYNIKDVGEKEARIRQEAEEVAHNQVQAASSCKTFCAGHKFELASHPDKKLESLETGEYLITSIQHQANQPYGSGAHINYSNNFSCIPAAYKFRPDRLAPKPIVSGAQTGVVTGPSGEEIYTDKYGRVKVFFHWDRETREIKTSEGENCSCWVRVAQNMAGREWGFMAIPRIGQEVVIEFLEGDPDRPLIVGSVYNSDQMPHYDPTEHKTRTYIKTNSSKGGDGFNELMFEDKADNEMVFVHAERNMDVRVKNDSQERIYGNRHQIIGWEKDGKKGGSQKEEIKEDKHVKVHGSQTEQVGGDMKLLVGGIGDGNQEIVIKKDKKELVEGENHRHVKLKDLNAIDGDQHTNIGGDCVLDVTGNYAQIAADHWVSGTNILVEGTAICLKSGGNSITIDSTGVTITGNMVQINSIPAVPVISQATMLQSLGPTDATEAAPAEPSQAHNSKTGMKSSPE